MDLKSLISLKSSKSRNAESGISDCIIEDNLERRYEPAADELKEREDER